MEPQPAPPAAPTTLPPPTPAPAKGPTSPDPDKKAEAEMPPTLVLNEYLKYKNQMLEKIGEVKKLLPLYAEHFGADYVIDSANVDYTGPKNQKDIYHVKKILEMGGKGYLEKLRRMDTSEIDAELTKGKEGAFYRDLQVAPGISKDSVFSDLKKSIEHISSRIKDFKTNNEEKISKVETEFKELCAKVETGASLGGNLNAEFKRISSPLNDIVHTMYHGPIGGKGRGFNSIAFGFAVLNGNKEPARESITNDIDMDKLCFLFSMQQEKIPEEKIGKQISDRRNRTENPLELFRDFVDGVDGDASKNGLLKTFAARYNFERELAEKAAIIVAKANPPPAPPAPAATTPTTTPAPAGTTPAATTPPAGSSATPVATVQLTTEQKAKIQGKLVDTAGVKVAKNPDGSFTLTHGTKKLSVFFLDDQLMFSNSFEAGKMQKIDRGGAESFSILFRKGGSKVAADKKPCYAVSECLNINGHNSPSAPTKEIFDLVKAAYDAKDK